MSSPGSPTHTAKPLIALFGALNPRTAALLTTTRYGLPGQVELRALNAAGQHEAVVSLFEGNRVANTQETLAEYVKALSRLDRLDPNRLYSLMQQVRFGRCPAQPLKCGVYPALEADRTSVWTLANGPPTHLQCTYKHSTTAFQAPRPYVFGVGPWSVAACTACNSRHCTPSGLRQITSNQLQPYPLQLLTSAHPSLSPLSYKKGAPGLGAAASRSASDYGPAAALGLGSSAGGGWGSSASSGSGGGWGSGSGAGGGGSGGYFGSGGPGSFAAGPALGSAAAAFGSGGAGAAGAAVDGAMGTPKNPLVMTFAEPSFSSQVGACVQHACSAGWCRTASGQRVWGGQVCLIPVHSSTGIRRRSLQA